LGYIAMADVFIDLEWFRCPEGYRFTTAGDAFPGKNWRKTWPDLDEEVLARNSGVCAPYRPLDQSGGGDLYLIFANIRSKENLWQFVQQFGPISSNFPGDSVSWWLRTAKVFRDLLSLKDRPKQLASFFNATKRRRYIEADIAQGISPPGEIDDSQLSQMVASIDLVAHPVGGMRLRISPDGLLGALWWQLGQKLSGNANFAECRHCGDWFGTGPGTGKHVDAEFCCNEHKVKYFSLQRSNHKGEAKSTSLPRRARRRR
jgi:hypothetical protein